MSPSASRGETNSSHAKTMDSNSPLFQPSYRKNSNNSLSYSALQQNQKRPFYSTPERDFVQGPPQVLQQMPMQNSQFGQQINVIPGYFEDPKIQMKMVPGYFEMNDYEERKTRNSTFSKASEGREDIQKNVVSFYEKAFVQDCSSIGFCHPVDDDYLDGQPSGMHRQPSGKSPSNFLSPLILDFLEEDAFFDLEAARQKSKTEFVRGQARERLESDESNQDEVPLPGETQAYLNSILSNNSIQFNKPAQSRFSFSNRQQRP